MIYGRHTRSTNQNNVKALTVVHDYIEASIWEGEKDSHERFIAAVHDDINTSIQKRVKEFVYYFIVIYGLIRLIC